VTSDKKIELGNRALSASEALLDTIKPTTTMEIIVMKATCELLREIAAALIEDSKK